MAYNFLGLVNDVNRRVNETELTDSTFAAAVGNYSNSKDAVNSAIRHINQDTFQWPFNLIEQEDILTAGEMRYDYPSNAKTIDFNTFRIKRNDTLGVKTSMLKVMDYEEYLARHIDDEYNTTDTGIRGVPTHVARAPGNKFVIYPAPSADYELVYEFYQLPVDLILYSDIPDLPDAFRHVIVDGSMYYVHLFRGDVQGAGMAMSKFNEGIKNMRSIYVNRFEYVRDTRTSPYAASNSRIS